MHAVQFMSSLVSERLKYYPRVSEISPSCTFAGVNFFLIPLRMIENRVPIISIFENKVYISLLLIILQSIFCFCIGPSKNILFLNCKNKL